MESGTPARKTSSRTKKYYLVRLLVWTALAVAAGILAARGFGIVRINAERTLMDALFILFCIFGSYYLLMLLSAFQIQYRHGGESEIRMLDSFNKVLVGLAMLIGGAYLLGRLDAFTSFFTLFGGMLLGWSLQAPVSGFAAWVMVTLMRPYRLGDRVQFPNLGLIGDVVKFSPMYLTLNQVGGSIGSEDPVGRMVNVPNAMLFGQVVINYTHQKTLQDASYILDEALFRVTLDSDWDTVESILLSTAQEVTGDIIAKTKIQPYIRADTWDYGTLFRLRYMTDATDRPRIMYEIVKRVTKAIQQNRNVDLSIPFVYSFKRSMEGAKTGQKSSENIDQIDISMIRGGRLDDEAYWKENEREVTEIADNINEAGLLQPIVVERDLAGNHYHILLGEKRLKACMLLGWEKIPAIIRNPFGINVQK